MENLETLQRDRNLLCSGDFGATLPELRQAYNVQELVDMSLIMGE